MEHFLQLNILELYILGTGAGGVLLATLWCVATGFKYLSDFITGHLQHYRAQRSIERKYTKYKDLTWRDADAADNKD
jgi:hypothetical protein